MNKILIPLTIFLLAVAVYSYSLLIRKANDFKAENEQIQEELLKKINEYDKQIKELEQKIKQQDNKKPEVRTQKVFVKDNSVVEEIARVDKCRDQYRKHSYCNNEQFRSKSKFKKRLKDMGDISKKREKEEDKKFDKCQEIKELCG